MAVQGHRLPRAGTAGTSSTTFKSPHARQLTKARALGPVLPEISAALHSAIDTIAAASGPLEPAVQVIGGDIANVVDLQPTLQGVGRLSVSAVHTTSNHHGLMPAAQCSLYSKNQLD